VLLLLKLALRAGVAELKMLHRNMTPSLLTVVAPPLHNWASMQCVTNSLV